MIRLRQKAVVPYIGTWIETGRVIVSCEVTTVVPYIGTWIETVLLKFLALNIWSYLI